VLIFFVVSEVNPISFAQAYPNNGVYHKKPKKKKAMVARVTER